MPNLSKSETLFVWFPVVLYGNDLTALSDCGIIGIKKLNELCSVLDDWSAIRSPTL